MIDWNEMHTAGAVCIVLIAMRGGVGGKSVQVGGKLAQVGGKLAQVGGKVLRVGGKLLQVGGKHDQSGDNLIHTSNPP
ncbi:hypothetical protein M3193_09445 [Sporosarcina luteola]|uniref:hypothetical protein n=1 Tax=Sporosarcina luteola TaxID=582850 RepID=UPI00203D42C2|nr:hypothetical protein [Sporosarcina luteola]MCM3744366.1 hypothetical protein [Sporosarcina luteola]